MDATTQAELARRLLAMKRDDERQLAPEAYRNPVREFTSREHLARERERFFRRGPILAGLGCDVREPGRYLALDIAGTPVVVARALDGSLHAFQNVCRHRGAQVVEGAGRTEAPLRCPYHGWSYDLTGRLVGCSSREGFPGVDAAEFSLVALPVAEAHGLVFVRPTPGEPIDADALLTGMEAELAPFGLGGYTPVETRENVRELNWKIVVDTFLEQYHVPHLHRRSIAKFFHRDLCVFDTFGRNGRLAGVRRSIEELETQPEEDRLIVPHTTLLYCIFPNTILIYQQDHVELWQIFPFDGSPARAAMRVTLYAPEPAADAKAAAHWKTNMDLLIQVTNDEDFTLGEKIQRGFHAGAQEAITFGRNEPGLIHYHTSLRDALAAGRENI